MKAIIEIEMDNAAFGHGTETALELSSVLTRLGDNCERHLVCEVGHHTTAADMNGNYVARLDIIDDKSTESKGTNHDNKVRYMYGLRNHALR
jgi:hypothetical protein